MQVMVPATVMGVLMVSTPVNLLVRKTLLYLSMMKVPMKMDMLPGMDKHTLGIGFMGISTATFHNILKSMNMIS